MGEVQTIEAPEDRAPAVSPTPARPLRPAAASLLAPAWLHADPVPVEVVAVFDRAVYLRRDQDVLPLLAPDALLLPGALRVVAPADLDALEVRVGDRVRVGQGQVRTHRGGVVVRRVWRPRPVPTAPLGEPARQAALAGLAGVGPLADLLADRLTELARASLAEPPASPAAPVRGLVGLGPGLTPAGDDVLCGLLLGLRATGRVAARSRLEQRVLPLLDRTSALSATLLRQAAQGYAVPPVVELLHAWHRGAGDPALAAAGRRVASVGHTSGPALLLGLSAVLTAPHTPTRPQPGPVASATVPREERRD